jgi:hypothetical protein
MLLGARSSQLSCVPARSSRIHRVGRGSAGATGPPCVDLSVAEVAEPRMCRVPPLSRTTPAWPRSGVSGGVPAQGLDPAHERVRKRRHGHSGPAHSSPRLTQIAESVAKSALVARDACLDLLRGKLRIRRPTDKIEMIDAFLRPAPRVEVCPRAPTSWRRSSSSWSIIWRAARRLSRSVRALLSLASVPSFVSTDTTPSSSIRARPETLHRVDGQHLDIGQRRERQVAGPLVPVGVRVWGDVEELETPVTIREK